MQPKKELEPPKALGKHFGNELVDVRVASLQNHGLFVQNLVQALFLVVEGKELPKLYQVSLKELEVPPVVLVAEQLRSTSTTLVNRFF